MHVNIFLIKVNGVISLEQLLKDRPEVFISGISFENQVKENFKKDFEVKVVTVSKEDGVPQRAPTVINAVTFA